MHHDQPNDINDKLKSLIIEDKNLFKENKWNWSVLNPRFAQKRKDFQRYQLLTRTIQEKRKHRGPNFTNTIVELSWNAQVPFNV